jgi:nucleotide-binding universal stress UspA family protein
VFEPIADYVAVTVGGVDNQAYQAAAERHLTDLVAECLPGHPRVTPLLRVGKPGPQILEFADTYVNDLIVLGVTGRSAADIIWFGSTANHVVRRATCPVLTLRT